MRLNPGPFEPVFYLLQTPLAFRIITMIGFVIFTMVSLAIAGGDGIGYAFIGLILLGAFWFESSVNVCRRCRFYGTWHCMGQGILVSRIFSRVESGLPESGVTLHAMLGAAFVLYGLYWLWHRPLLGLLFTLWLPLAFISATSRTGFSWRARKTG